MLASARPSPAGCSAHANGIDNPTPPAQPVDRRMQDVRNSWPAQPRDSAPEGPGEAQLVAVDIGVVEDQPAPPRPVPPGRLQDQIQEIVAGAEAGERGVRAAMDDQEPQ